MKRIFVSYRRTDSITITGRIYDRLVMAFGEQRVFKDVDDIPLGQDFRKTLEDEVSQCDVLCVIIGKEWANVRDSEGNRRLQDINDFVSIEVAVGLNRPNVLVVPCLVNGATMPTADELPPDLQDLRFRNAAIVRDDPDFNRDMIRLIEQIKKAEAYGTRTSGDARRRTGTGTPAKLAVIALGIILLLIIVALSTMLSGSAPPNTPTVLATEVQTSTPQLPTDTPVPSATPSPEPTDTPAPVEQRATTKAGAHVWPRPMAVRGDKFTTLDPGITVILIGDPVLGPIIYDSQQQGDWYQVRMPEETEPLGWIYVEHVTIP